MKKMVIIYLLTVQVVLSQSIIFDPEASSPGIEMTAGSNGIAPSQVALVSLSQSDPVNGIREGLLVYNTTSNAELSPGLYYWGGSAWERLLIPEEAGIPSGSIIEREQKVDIPGYTYLGFTHLDDNYIKSLGLGTGSWDSLPSYPHNGSVSDPTSAFLNAKFYVWSGQDSSYIPTTGNYLAVNTGAYYNTALNTWTSMSTVNAPQGRWENSVVIDSVNGEMVVWGGINSMTYSGAKTLLSSGGRYDLNTNQWITPSVPSSPLFPRFKHTAVITDLIAGLNFNYMVVWGGQNSSGNPYGDGAKYGPLGNSTPGNWSLIASSPLSPRFGHTAVSIGTKMIVYGGTDGIQNFNDGAIYDNYSNSWTSISVNSSNPKVYDHVAVWTGSKMIITGGNINPTGDSCTSITSIYDPITDTWTMASPAPGGEFGTAAFCGQKAIWNGTEMILAGGKNFHFNGGNKIVSAYNPSTDTWRVLNLYPEYINKPAMVWDGTKLLIQGGSFHYGTGNSFNDSSGTSEYIEVPSDKYFYKYRKD